MTPTVIKQYGRIYKHITEAVQSNFGRYTMPWKFDKTKIEIAKAAMVEYDADKRYPLHLHEALSDITLRWCWDGYKQTGKEDIVKIFQKLWIFHKKWMLIAEEHTVEEIIKQMDMEATNDINELCGGTYKDFEYRTENVISLYRVVMEHVISIAREDAADD